MINRGNNYNRFSIRRRAMIALRNKQYTLFEEIMTTKELSYDSKMPHDCFDERIKNFRKIPGYGSNLFSCNICGKVRIYGCTIGIPDNKIPFILCEGTCGKNTMHHFVNTHLGREEREFNA